MLAFGVSMITAYRPLMLYALYVSHRYSLYLFGHCYVLCALYITCCVYTHAQGIPSVVSDSDCSDHHLC